MAYDRCGGQPWLGYGYWPCMGVIVLNETRSGSLSESFSHSQASRAVHLLQPILGEQVLSSQDKKLSATWLPRNLATLSHHTMSDQG